MALNYFFKLNKLNFRSVFFKFCFLFNFQDPSPFASGSFRTPLAKCLIIVPRVILIVKNFLSKNDIFLIYYNMRTFILVSGLSQSPSFPSVSGLNLYLQIPFSGFISTKYPHFVLIIFVFAVCMYTCLGSGAYAEPPGRTALGVI